MVALFGIAVLAPAVAQARPAADPTAAVPTPSMADLPAGGHWVFDPGTAAGDRPAQRAQRRLVDPVPQPCKRTRSYPPGFEAYDCLAYYKDHGNRGHPVLLRRGIAGNSGFGYVHAFVDHGLDERSIAAVIVNNAAGRTRSNDRFLYGPGYQFGSHTLLRIEVIEQRTPSRVFNDGDGLGVVTAICVELDRCPDGINENIAASIDSTRR